jgi:hypothetical protein
VVASALVVVSAEIRVRKETSWAAFGPRPVCNTGSSKSITLLKGKEKLPGDPTKDPGSDNQPKGSIS